MGQIYFGAAGQFCIGGDNLGQLLPFLILLACPLMHLFGHGGHGGHGEHGGGSDTKPKDDARQLPPGGQGGHQH